jgi:hypothetical protein
VNVSDAQEDARDSNTIYAILEVKPFIKVKKLDTIHIPEGAQTIA